MQGDIVKAAKWFGLCLVISTLIGVIGLNIILDKNVRRLGSDIKSAGSASRSNVSFPGHFYLHHSAYGGPLKVDLSPNSNGISISPLKIELTTSEPAPQKPQ
jgi:hypothetical protein